MVSPDPPSHSLPHRCLHYWTGPGKVFCILSQQTFSWEQNPLLTKHTLISHTAGFTILHFGRTFLSNFCFPTNTHTCCCIKDWLWNCIKLASKEFCPKFGSIKYFFRIKSLCLLFHVLYFLSFYNKNVKGLCAPLTKKYSLGDWASKKFQFDKMVDLYFKASHFGLRAWTWPPD